MKFVDEYRQKPLVEKLIGQIRKEATGSYRFMEVCGSHTHAIRRFGLPAILPDNIKLLSGPGCPVCVTDQNYIHQAIHLAEEPQHIILTYGDLLRVPGNGNSLMEERELGADIRLVYSAMDAIKTAHENPGKRIIFLAIGFETTAPGTAVCALEAASEGLRNLYFLSALKTMPSAMKAVIDEGVQLNGYICPGHVSTITGSAMYHSLVENHHVAAVISGFEPVDILQSILMLIRQVNSGTFKVEIQYKRAVRPEGNPKAMQFIKQVFEPEDVHWRGFGLIPDSGLKLRPSFSYMDGSVQFDLQGLSYMNVSECICGEILKGKSTPPDCNLFNTNCTPENPIGACMVSSEGSCNAYAKYMDHE